MERRILGLASVQQPSLSPLTAKPIFSGGSSPLLGLLQLQTMHLHGPPQQDEMAAGFSTVTLDEEGKREDPVTDVAGVGTRALVDTTVLDDDCLQFSLCE